MDERFNPPPTSSCAVSIVIPMYNTEKYIGACLTSILAQTFQSFEVIVVNNCSTDNSAAVVESFIPQFGGRLRLSHTKRNSGGPGAPINKGINYASGKYIFIADSDDLLVTDALAKLYTAAETYRVDVVHMDRFLSYSINSEQPFPKPENISVSQIEGGIQPTIETDNIAERMQKVCNGTWRIMGWLNFVKRDLLVENGITFSNLLSTQDVIWLIELLFFAKKILRIPEPLYINRSRSDSVTRTKRSSKDHVSFWLDVGIRSLIVLDEFLTAQKFFQDNPHLRWQLLDYFERLHFGMAVKQWSLNEPPYKICETFKERLIDEQGSALEGSIDGDEELLAYLCTSSNFLRLNCMLMGQHIQMLEQRLRSLSGKA